MKKSVILSGGIGVALLVIGGVYFAFSGNSKDSINAYWDKNVDINQVSADGELPLIKAINAGSLEAVKKLLEHGAQPMAVNTKKINSLETALLKGNAEIFDELEKQEKSVLRQSQYLKAAIEGGNVHLVKKILDNGAKPNATLEVTGRFRPDEELDYTDPRVITPLRKAIEENKPEIVQLLLDRGAKGATFFFFKELSKGNFALIKVLANHIGNLRPLAVKGTDILTASVADAKPEVIEFLISKNAGDINIALLKFILSRKDVTSEEYQKIFDIFMKNGAVPSVDILQGFLKKGQQDRFVEMATCLKNPNMTLDGDDDNFFFYALKNKYMQVAKFLLNHNVDIWLLNHEGKSAMELVVEQMKDHADVYEAFKAKLSNINDSGYLGESLLMLVAKNGLFDEFQKIVNEGGDIWQKDHSGKTLLMYAAEGGNLDIIHYLVKKGDNVGAVDKNGKTPLMYAASAGKVDAVNDLINKGAITSDTDHEGKSVIMYAAESGQNEIVKILLDDGESAYAKDKNNKNVLMYALESGDIDTINTLARKGVDAMAMDKESRSVLSYAVRGGNVQAVNMLLKNGADIYAADKLGYVPLTWALEKGNKEIFDRVLGRIDVMKTYTKDSGRSLALHAYDGGNIELVRWSIKTLRTLFNFKDFQGQNFVMMMAQYGRPDMLRDVMDKGGEIGIKDNNDKRVLMYAAESENAVNLISLLQRITVAANREIEVKAIDKQGRTALMYAVGGKYNQNIKMQRLLQYGASLHAADKQGKSVLMYAVGNNQARIDNQMVRELLSKGANVNYADKTGKTALMYAAENPQLDINVLETIINVGGNVNMVDEQGKTVLMYAIAGGNISKIRLLLEKGASKIGRTKDGKDAIAFAEEIGPCYANVVRQVLEGK